MILGTVINNNKWKVTWDPYDKNDDADTVVMNGDYDDINLILKWWLRN